MGISGMGVTTWTLIIRVEMVLPACEITNSSSRPRWTLACLDVKQDASKVCNETTDFWHRAPGSEDTFPGCLIQVGMGNRRGLIAWHQRFFSRMGIQTAEIYKSLMDIHHIVIVLAINL